jgi:PKD repeat protein
MADILLANVSGKIQKSINYGTNWTIPYSGSYTILSFCVVSTYVLALTSSGNILKSIDGGDNWSDLGQKITGTLYAGNVNVKQSRLVYLGNNTVATICNTSDFCVSTDGGNNWSNTNIGAQLSSYTLITCICEGFSNGEAFIGCSTSTPGSFSNWLNRIYRTTDYGSNWSVQNGGSGGAYRLKKTGDGYLVGIEYRAVFSNPFYLTQFYTVKYQNSNQTWSFSFIAGQGLPQIYCPIAAGSNKACSMPKGDFYTTKLRIADTPYSSWGETTDTSISPYELYYFNNYLYSTNQSGTISRSLSAGVPSWSISNNSGAAYDMLGFNFSNPSPVANFSANPLNGFYPLTVQFTDMTTNSATNWSWDFGDGSLISNTQNPLHIYNNAGTYSVILSSSNLAGSDIKSKSNYISVSRVIYYVDFSAVPIYGVSPLTVQFMDTTQFSTHGYKIKNYLWNFGDDTPILSTTNSIINHVYVGYSGQTFTVSLTVEIEKI